MVFRTLANLKFAFVQLSNHTEKTEKILLTYYQFSNMIISTRDIIKVIITKSGGSNDEEDLNRSRYAERFY